MKAGTTLIAIERKKQVKKYGKDHDAQHREKEIIQNAISCLQSYLNGKGYYEPAPNDDEWGLGRKHNAKPQKLLIVAGALIAAEIDRRQKK